MTHLVGKCSEQCGLTVPLKLFLKIVTVNLERCVSGFPQVARRLTARLRPAGNTFGKVVVPEFDLEAGADLATGPDVDLRMGVGSVDTPALEFACSPFPR